MSYYEFGSFQFDDERMVLRNNRRLVALEPKTKELLLTFLKDPKKRFSKDELLEEVWPGKIVEEGNLPVQISALREAFEKESRDNDYIETVHGHGYRFTAEVRVRDGRQLEAAAPATQKVQTVAVEVLPGETDSAETTPTQPTQFFISGWRIKSILAYSIPLSIILFVLITIARVGARLAEPSHISVARYVQLTNDAQEKADELLLTDGARVYFKEEQTNGDVFASVAVGGGSTGHIPLPKDIEDIYDLYPQTSELLVGRRVSDQLDRELWVIPLLGPSPRRIANLRADSASWSPDQLKIAFTLRNSLYVANVDGSESKKIADVSGSSFSPRWSPDAKLIRFSQSWLQDSGISQTIWEVGVDGSNLHRVLGGWNNPPHECCGVWTQDGNFFIFQSEHGGRKDLWAVSEHRGLWGTTSESPVRLSFASQAFSSPVIGDRGKQVFAIGTDRRGELVRYDNQSKAFVPFLDGIPATWVSFSKSGHSVAYIDYRDRSIWRANADGSQKFQITFPPFEVDGLAWSPDEKTLALRGRIPGKPWNIYLVPSTGGEYKALIPGNTEQGIPTWSADGTRIAFGDVPREFSKPSGGEAIHILELNNHARSEVPESRGLWSSRWSPDGHSLSALTIEEQRLMLYDFTTKKWRSTDAKAVNNPTWSSDSKYIYFDTNIHDQALRRVRVADGHVDLLTRLHAYPDLAWWWSGVTPDNSPLILRNLGSTEIYSLALEYR